MGTISLGLMGPWRDLGAVGREGVQAPAIVMSEAEDPSLFWERGDSSRSQGGSIGGRAEPDYVHLGKMPLGVLWLSKQMIPRPPRAEGRIFIPAPPSDWRPRPGRKHFTVFPSLSNNPSSPMRLVILSPSYSWAQACSERPVSHVAE